LWEVITLVLTVFNKKVNFKSLKVYRFLIILAHVHNLKDTTHTRYTYIHGLFDSRFTALM